MSTRVGEIRSAGVLPFTVVSRDVLFLLGKETYVPRWRESDKWGVFGGRVERRANAGSGATPETPEAAAARECYEETAGALMPMAELRQLLEAKEYKLAVDLTGSASGASASGGGCRSVCYFVYVPYNPDFPDVFLKTKHFVQYCKGKVDCIEKSQVKWFSLSQVYRDIVGGAGGASSGTNGAAVSMPGFGRRPLYRKKFRDLMLFFFQNNHETHLRARTAADRSAERYFAYACAPAAGGGAGPEDSTGDDATADCVPSEQLHEDDDEAHGDDSW
jgi:8-oxo-dGTP pyrophosphatase MutT (NUDIX family)